MSVRQWLYRIASLIGDFNAARKGPEAIVKRIVRKAAYKTASKELNRWV